MYFLFHGDNYYPGGGMQDYVGVFPTLEACEVWLNDKDFAFSDQWANAAVFRDGQLVQVCDWEPESGDKWLRTMPNGHQYWTTTIGLKRRDFTPKPVLG